MTNPDTFAYWALCLPLALSPMVQADDSLGQRTRFGVPMSCAAFALIRSADYPEAVRVYDERHEPRSFEEADRAALGLLWRHRACVRGGGGEPAHSGVVRAPADRARN